MCQVAQNQTASAFVTTHWSEIRAVRTASPERRRAMLENLTRRYWKPVYHYLRAKGHQDADARDITQDFFVDVVLGRDLFGQAEPHRGRFRPFLLHCLKNYVRDRRRRKRARCRAPSRIVVSIHEWANSESSRDLPATPGEEPEDVFHRKWAASLLEQVLGKLHAGCEAAGLTDHLDIFRLRFVRPALEHTAPVSLEELARRYHLTTRQVSDRAKTVRRRFRRLLLEEVRLTVTDESAATEELGALLGSLSGTPG